MARKPAPDLRRVVIDPAVMVVKPVIRGTRIPVALILKHLADDPSLDELFAAYPHLMTEDVRAALAYAEAAVTGDAVYPLAEATRSR